MALRTIMLAVAAWACGTEPEPPPVVNVLFIGNSLTYAYDLPATVAAIARADSHPVHVEAVTGPGLALIDHLNGSTDAAARIASRRWDFVVLQQGPTTVGLCRDSLILVTRMFDARIRAAGGRTVMYMPWPFESMMNRFDNVRVSFGLAADTVHGLFAPAGEAWRAAWREEPGLALYSPDGLHPTALGSYLAALTIYERLSGRNATALTPRYFVSGRPVDLPVATIRLLQAAAHSAIVAYPTGTAVMAEPAPIPVPTGGSC